MSSTGIILNDIAMIRSATIEQLEVQARMMEFNSDGVLAFADAARPKDLLQLDVAAAGGRGGLPDRRSTARCSPRTPRTTWSR